MKMLFPLQNLGFKRLEITNMRTICGPSEANTAMENADSWTGKAFIAYGIVRSKIGIGNWATGSFLAEWASLPILPYKYWSQGSEFSPTMVTLWFFLT